MGQRSPRVAECSQVQSAPRTVGCYEARAPWLQDEFDVAKSAGSWLIESNEPSCPFEFDLASLIAMSTFQHIHTWEERNHAATIDLPDTACHAIV